MSRSEAINAFIASTRFAGAELNPLAGDASFRRYIRLHKDGGTAMLMDAPPEREDVRPYVAVAQQLHAKGYSAPAILARDVAQGFLLLEDLGDETFSTVLRAEPALEAPLYEAAIDLLVSWHSAATPVSKPAELSLSMYDEALLMREVALFCDWFLPQCVGIEQAAALRAEYLCIWKDIIGKAKLGCTHFVHRDYHADNLMWLPRRSDNARVGLLDFQDAVYGEAAYDLVSLLEDARRDVPAALVAALKAHYMQAAGVDKARFELVYALLAAQRNSKIVGIFARLAARDGKQAYLHFLPRVWGHLQADLAHPALAELARWTDAHVPAAYRGVISIRHNAAELARTA